MQNLIHFGNLFQPHDTDISMKNFSTVGTGLAAAALFATLAAGPAQAASCQFLPNAPDQHLVVKGDTLWDISGKFLEHPWCWPQVWGLNRDEIKNPHWIYPGQIVYFDRANGRLTLARPGAGGGSGQAGEPGTVRLSPQFRTEGLGKDAIASISSGMIEPFLSQPLIVEADELKGAPRIAAAEAGHVYLGKDDKIYVRGELHGIESFQVYRPGTPLKDPGTGKVIAYEAHYLGTVKLQTAAKPGVDVHTFVVASSKQEMGVGDLLKPAPPTPLRNYVPHQPERQVEGRVMSIYDGVSYAGQNQVISINRGSVDGLDIGSVLQLYHFGKTVADPGGNKGRLGLSTPTMKLPDEQYGTLFIFRVFNRISYGLVMQVTAPVEVGDMVKSPE